MLDEIRDLPGGLFVTAPDVVGNAQRTRILFDWWCDRIAASRKPVGYVLQDGQLAERVPWTRIGAVFVGGTTEFKMGEAARELVYEARGRGLWVHMGRVNSHQRLRYAKAIGCDSVDGTSFSWFRDRWLREFLDHAAAPTQGLLA
jgi:hypothetical protein